jgi:hypothetical protein
MKSKWKEAAITFIFLALITCNIHTVANRQQIIIPESAALKP